MQRQTWYKSSAFVSFFSKLTDCDVQASVETYLSGWLKLFYAMLFFALRSKAVRECVVPRASYPSIDCFSPFLQEFEKP